MPTSPSPLLRRTLGRWACLATCLAFVAPLESRAQTTRAAAASASTQPDTLLPPARTALPVDSLVQQGRLANGMRWFIRKNSRPANRAELRLVVNAGSVLEHDDQRGLAHFLEHMAFNGTARFEKNEIVKYLESIGVRFGADLNAYTGFDETVYILPVPTDSAGLLSRGFDILQDWASAVSFDSAQVVGERGVVLEEWRGSRGASSRVLDWHFPVLFAGSRYAERLPIGDTAIIGSATPGPLRQFYRDWYRPNNMAVIAVGDFNVDSVKSLITQRFSGLANPPRAPERNDVPVPSTSGTRVSIANDAELQVSTAELLWRVPTRQTRTVGDWKARLTEDIYNAAFNRRLGELSQRPNAAWVGASSGVSSYARSATSYGLSVAAGEDKIEVAVSAIVREARRVREYGFLESEITRVKTDLLRSYERAYAERDRSESDGYADSYIQHFLTGEPVPGITYYNRYVAAAVRSISPADVNALARTWMSGDDRVVLASIASDDPAKIPTSASLLAAVNRAEQDTISAWTETVTAGALVAKVPSPGSVVTRARIEELDISEWRLSNGVRVLLKSTDFKADELLVSAFSPGGTSLLPDSLATAGDLAPLLLDRGGVGDLSMVELQKKLSGKVAQVGVSLGSTSQDLTGRASPKDLETLFQLIWLKLTLPRVDSAAVQAFRQQIGAVLANRSKSPEAQFSDTLSLTLSNYHPRVQLPTAELFNSVTLDEALAIYRDRFGDAGNLTFLFVGNVSAADLEPLLVQWLAPLPASGRVENWRDIGVRPPNGVIEKTVRAGVEPKASTVIVYHADSATTVASRQALRTFGDVLEMRLTEQLREALGGTYSVGVSASAATEPRDAQQVVIQYGSSPANVDTLFATVKRVLRELIASGPTSEELASALEQQRRSNEVAQRENGYWLSAIDARLRRNVDPRQMLEATDIINATSGEAVRAAARAAVSFENYVRVVLLPAAAP